LLNARLMPSATLHVLHGELTAFAGRLNVIGAWLTPDLRGRLKAPDADAIAGALMVARRRFALPGRQAEGEPASEFRV
jgi:glucosamine kinase